MRKGSCEITKLPQNLDSKRQYYILVSIQSQPDPILLIKSFHGSFAIFERIWATVHAA